MSNELIEMSDGTFTLAETENKNQLLFYRNDGEVLGSVDRIPMDFYQNYICKKMMEGEIAEVVMNDICFETSDDGKCIRLSIYGADEDRKDKKATTNNEKPSRTEKQPNFFKRIFKIIFG